MASTTSPSTSKRKHNFHTVEKKQSEIILKLDKAETGISLARLSNASKIMIIDIKKKRTCIVSL